MILTELLQPNPAIKMPPKLVFTLVIVLLSISPFLNGQSLLPANKGSSSDSCPSFSEDNVNGFVCQTITDTSMVYTIDIEFIAGEKRKLYLTIGTSGTIKNLKVVENRFDFYDVKFNPEGKKIKSISYSFEDK